MADHENEQHAGDGARHEHQRLARQCTGMSEGELQKLAEDASSLTEVARQALQSELSHRGSQIKLDYSAVSAEEAQHPKLITLRQFTSVPEALLAKSILDSEGIECFLADENTIRLDWLLSNAIGGIKLWVKEDDVAKASNLLEQKPSEGFDVEGGEEYKQPRCPYCQSADITFGELDKRLAHAIAFVGVPIPLRNAGWKCHSCGRTWEET